MPNDVKPEQLNAIVRHNIRQLRDELGLSQGDVAERINRRRKKTDAQVHAPYVSDVENGKRVPLVGTLADFADALETTPDALLVANNQ